MDERPDQPTPEDAPTRPDVAALGEAGAGSADLAAPPGPRRRRWIPVTVGVALVVFVAAGVGAFLLLRGSDEVLFDQVPATADVVVAAYLDPAASQKVNLFRMAERFPDMGTRDEVTGQVDDFLDEALADTGLTHEDLSWVGVEIAVWADVRGEAEFEGAALIDSDDDAGAQATVDRLLESLREQGDDVTSTTHAGVEVWTIDETAALAYADHTLILGSSPEAVGSTIDAGRGDVDAIDASADFQDAFADLPQARLFAAYTGIDGLTDALGDALATAEAAGSPINFGGAKSVAMTLSATEDGLAVDWSQVNDPARMSPELVEVLDEPPHENGALSMVPGDAFGVFAVEHMDALAQESIDALVEQEPSAAADLEELGVTGSDGLLANLSGDLAIEAAPGGEDPAAGALMVGVQDMARMETFIDDALADLGGAAPTWTEEDHRGVTLRTLDDETLPLTYAVVNGMLVIGSSPEHVARIVDVSQDGGGLSQDEGFTAATADLEGADALMFLDVPSVLQAVRDELPPDEVASFDDEMGRNLDPIGHVVMGVEGDATRQHMRFFVQIP